MHSLSFLSGLILGALICALFQAAAAKFSAAQSQFDRATKARRDLIDAGHTANNSRLAGANSMLHAMVLYGVSLGLAVVIAWLIV